MKAWTIIEAKKEYEEAKDRLEEIFHVRKGHKDYKEMLLVSLLINLYEKEHFKLGEIDPIEIIKFRMEDFDLKPADLAKAYGDKGTVSKVLNYKQPLSLNMMRLFSKMLRIPVELLVKEYKLRP